MEGKPAIYLGRLVSKENFRTFIYSPDGSQRLVESWDEYERFMETGLWFALKEDAMTRIAVEKKKRTCRVPVMTLELKEEPLSKEVKITTDDDFLPIT